MHNTRQPLHTQAVPGSCMPLATALCTMCGWLVGRQPTHAGSEQVSCTTREAGSRVTSG